MQDGSNRTFWHSRFNPTVAEPPHFVIIHNKKHERSMVYHIQNGQVETVTVKLRPTQSICLIIKSTGESLS